VAQTITQREVRLEFPRVAHVGLKAVVSLSSSWEPKIRLFREETLAVAKKCSEKGVCCRVAGGRSSWATPRGRGKGLTECCSFEQRGDSDETGESPAIDVIETETKTEDVRLINLASVI